MDLACLAGSLDHVMQQPLEKRHAGRIRNMVGQHVVHGKQSEDGPSISGAAVQVYHEEFPLNTRSGGEELANARQLQPKPALLEDTEHGNVPPSGERSKVVHQ